MKSRYLALCLAVMSLLSARAAETLATSAATLELDHPVCEIAPHLFLPNWQMLRATGGLTRDEHGAFPFKFVIDDTEGIRGTAVFATTPSHAVAATYTFIPVREVKLNCLYVGTTLPTDAFAGGSWAADGRQGTLPLLHKNMSIYSGLTRTLTLATANGQGRLAFTFPEPTGVLIQDDRQWGPTFSLRIGHVGDGKKFPAGVPFVVRFTLATQEPQHLTLDAPVHIQAGSDWIPLKDAADILPGSALDFTALRLTDAPAGKHGWVVARGPHFEFEGQPGVAQRFYGVNLCFTANFLEPAQAAAFAGRLARTGYNAVRLHHYDGGLVEGSKDGTTLNAANLARLDALVAACITNGIYLTTDLYVSRPVPWRSIGIDRAGTIPMNAFKVLVPVHEGAWRNQQAFTRQLLSHVNPYTGRRYADEPALAWLAMINEGNFGNYLEEMHAIPEWQQAWQTWLAQKQAQEPQLYRGVPATLPNSIYGTSRHITAFVLFLQETEARMIRRTQAFLRDELGCRALITNRNAWTNFATDQVTREELYDYVDDHFYVDHPEFLERSWQLPSRCANVNPLKNEALGAQHVIFTRLLNKPFTITEYNFSAPGRFRGVGGILTGAMGALQDWSGIWRFAFSHSRDDLMRPEGYALDYFDMAGDPLSMAAERASLCLFLRGDLSPLKRSYAMVLPKADILRMCDAMPQNFTPWRWLAWYARLGTVVAESAPKGSTWSARFPEVYGIGSDAIRKLLAPDPAVAPVAGDGAVTLDQETGAFVLNTPRTSGGFTEGGVIAAGALTCKVTGSAATVWVSVLDDRPIKSSAHLLLTHLTDMQNSGIRYAQQSRKTLLAWGGLPHLVCNGKAEIQLDVRRAKKFKVYALATNGRRVAEVPANVVNGDLAFTAAVDLQPDSATMLYELVKE